MDSLQRGHSRWAAFSSGRQSQEGLLYGECDLAIRDREPAKYLSEVAARDPKLLEEHCIPMDRDLWEIPRYLDFLQARRAPLAEAGNRLLERLLHGDAPRVTDHDGMISSGDPSASQVPGSIDGDGELDALIDLNDWMTKQGLPEGELEYELADGDSGRPLAVLDLAWPDGLQPGLTQPVALLLDETRDAEKAVNSAGFLFFTAVDDLRQHVQKLELGLPRED